MKPENVLLKQQGRSGIKVGQTASLIATIENNFFIAMEVLLLNL